MSLPDLIKHRLSLIICGTAVTKTSKKRNAYYANMGNSLYLTLFTQKFTPDRIAPAEYVRLLDYGIGFTDLVKNKTGLDHELRKNDFDIVSFRQKIKLYKPAVICFNGKKAATVYLGLKSTKDVQYGLLDGHSIGKTLIFVAPSTAAQARKYWDETYWAELKKLISRPSKSHFEFRQ